MFEWFKAKLIKGAQIRQKSVSFTTFNPYSVQATMACYDKGSYDNNYPNITKIAEQFAVTLPYAIDGNGEQLPQVPAAVAALYRPNKQMSPVRFFKTIAVMALVHPAVYLVVWHENNGKSTTSPNGLTRDNITGYTFLEDYRIEVENGKKVYYTSHGEKYTEDSVITLSLDVNPYAVLAGYSPSIASKKWATVDDYIVDYQQGYFRNGAIPAGQFIITAPTVDDFNDTVDYLQKHHRGAKNNNNVVYTHRPTNERGEAQEAQIQWIPFSEGGNKNLALKDLFEQAEKVRDTSFGVPAEVKGMVKNSNYASVATASHIFEKYTVYPKLLQIWSDFTHELNRITGGLGYSITFDYDIEPLADEQKLKAETQKTQMELIGIGIERGYTLDSIVEAFCLPDDLKKLEEKVPEAQDPEFEPKDDTDVDQLETSTKTVKSKRIEDVAEVDPELVKAIDDSMLEQIESAIRGGDFGATKERNEKMSAEMFKALIVYMLAVGAAQYSAGRIMLTGAGVDVPASGSYKVSDKLQKRYGEFLTNVARSYNEDTANSIRKVLDRAEFERWDNVQRAEGLRKIMETDEWRVQRLARSETHRSNGLASLDSMEQVQDETGVEIEKTWRLNPYSLNHCPECEALDGVTIDLEKAFISEEDNEWADIESADAHPNCGCYLQYSIKPISKSVDVECPKCSRHLMKAKDGEIEGVKCQGCKTRFNFKIAGGKVMSEEVKKEAQNGLEANSNT